MQIDHDPRELSHRALKAVAVVTFIVTVALMVPVTMGMRWAVSQLPDFVPLVLCGLFLAFSIGFYVGRWDAFKQLLPNRPSWLSRHRDDIPAVLQYSGVLLLKAPFAVFILPIKTWRKAREDGDSLPASIMSLLTGLVFGFIITWTIVLLITVLVVVVGGY